VLDTEVTIGSGLTLDQTSCENSVYAATTIGPSGTIYTGTFFGMSRYSPGELAPGSVRLRAHSGIDQALDLLARVEATLDGERAGAAREFLGRAYRQLSATLSPTELTGPPSAYDDVVAARDSIDSAFDAVEEGDDPNADVVNAIELLTNAARSLN
jgi:hypothetical protein